MRHVRVGGHPAQLCSGNPEILDSCFRGNDGIRAFYYYEISERLPEFQRTANIPTLRDLGLHLKHSVVEFFYSAATTLFGLLIADSWTYRQRAVFSSYRPKSVL